MTTTTAYRTAWTANNIHITDERGSFPKGTYYAALWGERFNGIKRGRFLIGTIIVEIAKGKGYRVALKNPDKECVLDTVIRDCPGRDSVCELAAEYITANKPARVIALCERLGIQI